MGLDEKLTDVAGRVNKAKVLEFCRSWEQAIGKDILCTIFCWYVSRYYL